MHQINNYKNISKNKIKQMFLKRDIQMAKTYIERCLPPVAYFSTIDKPTLTHSYYPEFIVYIKFHSL